jgi:hypothetical protein
MLHKQCINNTSKLMYGDRSIHCKKRLSVFPSPAGISLTNLSLARNNLIIPGQGEVGIVTSRLGTGKSLTFF